MKLLFVKVGQGDVEISNLFELDGWIHQQIVHVGIITIIFTHTQIYIYSD